MFDRVDSGGGGLDGETVTFEEAINWWRSPDEHSDTREVQGDKQQMATSILPALDEVEDDEELEDDLDDDLDDDIDEDLDDNDAVADCDEDEEDEEFEDEDDDDDDSEEK